MRDVIQSTRLPFISLLWGEFRPAQVVVRHRPEPRPTTGALDQLIADEWDRRLADAQRKDLLLFDGPMLRYVDHSLQNGAGGPRFEMTVGPTGYRDFVGTNLYNSSRLDEFGWHCFSNPVGTTATLITSDGLLWYGLRSQRVAFHAGHVHTFGGALEPGDRSADGSIDVFASVRRELLEELGLQAGELGDLRCVGLIRDRFIHQPEMIFEARLDMDGETFRQRWQGADEQREHVDLISCPDRPGAIVPFVQGQELIAPVAVGSLFLHGRLAWGDEWMAAAIDDLPA
jgi:8-oxo-dGTP pyrophosphatase MutT (NUDIX family)